VCAVRIHNVGVDLLRSYPTQAWGQRDHNCYIWEAARATAAAPAFFEPIQLHDGGATFVDGGIVANNPVEEALKEANIIWPDIGVGVLLSLGTGVAVVKSFAKKKEAGHDILEKIVTISMNADRQAEKFKEGFGATLHKAGKYFRFSVEQQISDVELGDVTSYEKQEDAADYYVKTKVDMLKSCAEEMARPTHFGA